LNLRLCEKFGIEDVVETVQCVLSVGNCAER
jgi:hypothetical protein